MNGALSLRVIGGMGTSMKHDGLGGRAIANILNVCEGRGDRRQ